ncbi:DUF1995 family protein [Merismopedia glauca]|uniref:DUF1995 domain-containing protein n=1 Tax=Merismopedia glauca CCAP 1448/3 TaxID=1296344 RepID=A0A2T1C4K4_9CYAN|nr:DUF1995 family protein [Merismopedia glauca]PSB03189.1 DUF1995 domain-containing protein [Merismopedia glauca CCAP 1448/3]
MVQLPESLEEAIAQAREATTSAIADGYTRLMVEILFPELKGMPIAKDFIPAFSDLGSQLRVLFPDAGAAALAKRDWGEVEFKIDYLGTNPDLVAEKIQPEDKLLLVIEPSSVEVSQAEKLCQAAGDRTVVMLMPKLEDTSVVGIGYAARQLRERFLSKLVSCYHLRPLDGAAVFRCYPSGWQVLRETPAGYQLVVERAEKPMGDEVIEILTGGDRNSSSNGEAENTSQFKRPGFLSNLQQMWRALTN